MVRTMELTRRGFWLGALATTLLAGGAMAQQPLKVGTVLSTTGPAAFLGEDMKRGMEIAVNEINAAGGINGRKIEWIFYDAESQAAKGVNATKRLIEQDKVDMIVGGGNMSGIALGMVPLTEKAEMPFISTEGALSIVAPVGERQYASRPRSTIRRWSSVRSTSGTRRASRRSRWSPTIPASPGRQGADGDPRAQGRHRGRL